MSIIKREKSTIGMYHVLAQGAGNNELFHDDEDYQVFVEYGAVDDDCHELGGI